MLGDHIDQKGSIVQPERLRFDFSHGGAIDGPMLGRIEALCSDQLARDLPIYAQDVALADARPISGAPLAGRELAKPTFCIGRAGHISARDPVHPSVLLQNSIGYSRTLKGCIAGVECM